MKEFDWPAFEAYLLEHFRAYHKRSHMVGLVSGGSIRDDYFGIYKATTGGGRPSFDALLRQACLRSFGKASIPEIRTKRQAENMAVFTVDLAISGFLALGYDLDLEGRATRTTLIVVAERAMKAAEEANCHDLDEQVKAVDLSQPSWEEDGASGESTTSGLNFESMTLWMSTTIGGATFDVTYRIRQSGSRWELALLQKSTSDGGVRSFVVDGSVDEESIRAFCKVKELADDKITELKEELNWHPASAELSSKITSHFQAYRDFLEGCDNSVAHRSA